MKTTQIISRPFMGREIHQRHTDQYFCVNDLTAIANKRRQLLGQGEARWDNYVSSKHTIEFFEELMKQKGIVDLVYSSRGKGGGTWAHPLVFFDYAMYLSAEFKVQVYEWLYDCMTIYRDDSGESYKKMCGHICNNGNTPAKATMIIQSLAKAIKRDLQVEDWNKTTPDKLKKRDEIHNGMILLMSAGVEAHKAYSHVLQSCGVSKCSE